MTRRINILTSTDWFTVILYLLLIFLGWINIYAAVYNEQHHSILDMTQRYGKQSIWIIAALVMAILIFIIDTKFYSFFAYFIYGFTILLLIGVLIIGKEINGARSWFAVGGFRVQPAEFAKVATALALARFMSGYNISIKNFKNLAIVAFIIFFPAFLIFLQPDTGSALVYASFFLVLYREGMHPGFFFMGILVAILFFITLMMEPFSILVILISVALITYALINKNIKQLFAGALIIAASAGLIFAVSKLFGLQWTYTRILLTGLLASVIPLLYLTFKHKLKNVMVVLAFLGGAVAFTNSVDYVFDHVLKEHQRRRINIMLGLESDPLGVGYNVNQSKIAIGSGGLAGKGFLKGTQTKFDFVPEQSTDFIFCTVGEEWGFLGTTTVLILFSILLIRLLIIAERQRSSFSRIYGYGVVSIIFFHVAINIGMTIGLVPVIGIPLPFFSYGGSSLWAFTILLFVLLRLDASRMELLR